MEGHPKVVGHGHRFLFGREHPACPVSLEVDEEEVVGVETAALEEGFHVGLISDELPELARGLHRHAPSVWTYVPVAQVRMFRGDLEKKSKKIRASVRKFTDRNSGLPLPSNACSRRTLDRARQALADYPDDPSDLTDDQAASGFTQLQRISELVEAKRLRWLADQDRRASFRRDGYLSSAAWLADRFRVAAGSAKRQVQVAQSLEHLPAVRQSFVSGEVTSSAVQVLAEAHREHPGEFADEEGLVDAAKTLSLIHIDAADEGLV
jgi:hypothetical protein